MDSKHELKLAEVVGQELRKLSERQAPPDLAARVLSRIREDEQLAQIVHAKLHLLPDREAPLGLIPEVLRQLVGLQARPWWTRPWNTWPVALQFCALIVSLGLAELLMLGLGALPVSGLLSGVTGWGAATLHRAEPFVQGVLALLDAGVLVFGKMGVAGWAVLAGLFVAMYVASIGFGTACFRVATGRRLRGLTGGS